jgi:hypothetical protein
MNKIKHNKYKNTGILFELLIRQIASDTVSGKDSAAVNLVKKYFSKTELMKEHTLYQTLLSSKILTEAKAESLINTTLELSSRLNKSALRKEKYNLIKSIRETYNIEDFFKAKINQYAQCAAIYNLIESHNSSEFNDPNQIHNNKVTLLEHISRKETSKSKDEDSSLEEYASMDRGTRMLIYRTLLEKFNDKYNTLSTVQKSVLKEYINNISNTVKLREFINTNYTNIKVELRKLNKVVTDKTTQIKINEIINILQPLDKNQNIKDDNIVALLQFHQLVAELKVIN